MSILPQLEHCSSKKMNTWLGVWDVGERSGMVEQKWGWGKDSRFGERKVFRKRGRSLMLTSVIVVLFIIGLIFSESRGELVFGREELRV